MYLHHLQLPPSKSLLQLATKTTLTQLSWKSMKKHPTHLNALKTDFHNMSNLSLKNMKQGVDMKDTKRMVFDVGRGSFTTRTEAIMTANGRTTKCMDGANSIMKEENWPMKVTGQMMSFMAMEKSTMTILCQYREVWALTTQTLTCLTTTGSTMRVCW